MEQTIKMKKTKDTKTTAVYQADGSTPNPAVSTVYVNLSAFADGKPTDTIELTVKS